MERADPRSYLIGGRKMKIKRICKTCGKTFYVKPSKVKYGRGKYCSLVCRNISYSKNNRGENNPSWKPKIKRICKTCGNEFELPPSRTKGKNKGIYCSRNCWHIALSENSKGENSNFWKGGKMKRSCEECEKVFYTSHSRIENGRGKYCCFSCRSIANRRKQKFPTHHTKPERILTDMLKQNNLPFKYVGDSDFWIHNINPDFIESNGKKIAIEVFGDYWHSPLLNYNLREDRTLPYRKRILKKHGWKLIVLWESDLKRKDAEAFVLYTLEKHNISPSTT